MSRNGYDVFLSHSSADKPSVERIAEKLARAGLEPWLDKWYLTGGGQWQDELATALRASSACAVFIGGNDLGAWAHEELGLARDRAAKDHGFRLIPVLLPGLSEPFDPTTLPAFLSTRTWVDFRGGVDDSRALRALVNAVKGIAPGPDGRVDRAGDVCPYRGLEVFDAEHAEFFFGRDADLQRLVEKLKSTRLLTVLGPSGSGKSSLVRAGLVPLLGKGALTASETWPVVVLRPGGHPLTALAAPLVHLSGERGMQKTLEELGTDAATLHLSVALALSSRPESERVVVVVDQFEEVFTLCRDETERVAFVDNLLYAGGIPGGRAVVVLTMRADFYPRAAAYPELAQQLAAHQFLVTPMDEAAIRRAIEEPARAVGLELESGLVETILDDVKSEPGALPLLEHALLELWKRRRGAMLTLEGYRETGGVEGALAQHAGAVWSRFDEREQAIGRRIFLRLTQPGEGAEDTRRRAPTHELVTRPEDEEAVESIVQTLANERLLTTSRQEESTEPLVEVSHEALIRGWPRLRSWVEEDRQALLVHRRLTEAAQEWVTLEREPGALYRGARLLSATDWAKENDSELNPLEREFLVASRAAESSELEESKRRSRRLRGLAIGLAVLLVLAAVSALLAVAAARRAQRQQDIALSRALATEALARFDSNLDLAMLLSLEAFRAHPTDAARNAAITAVQRSTGLAGVMAGDPVSTYTIAFSPDGRTIAAAGADYTITLWDVASRRPRGPPLTGHTDEIFVLAFSADGKTLVSAGDDDTIRIWDVPHHRLARKFEGGLPVAFSKSGVVAYDDFGETVLQDITTGKELMRIESDSSAEKLAISRDGRTLAASDLHGVLTLWSLVGGRAVPLCRRTRLAHGDAIESLDFSSDGRRLVSGGFDGKLVFWDVSRCRRRGAVQADDNSLNSVAFSPKGDLIASGGEAGTVRLWNARTRREIGTARRSHDTVNRVAFSPDGRTVAAAGDPGTIKLWDLSGGHALSHESLKGKVASDVAFSPDGRFLAVLRGTPYDSNKPARLDGTIEFWDVQTRTRRGARLSTPRSSHVAFSPDGRSIASAGEAGDVDNGNGTPYVRLWNVATRRPLGGPVRVGGKQEAVDAIAFAPDGRLLATSVGASSTSGSRVVLRRVPGLEQVRRLKTKLADVQSLAFSPDGSLLAVAGGEPPEVELWDSHSFERVDVLRPAGPRYITQALFSPDGGTLAGVGFDGVVHLWDGRTRRPGAELHHTIYGPDTGAFMSFSGDGRTLAYVAVDGSLVLWDVASGSRLGEPLYPGGNFDAVAFSPRNDVLVSAGGGPGLSWWDKVLWSDDLDSFKRRLCPIVGRSLTPAEWREFLPGKPRSTCD